MTIFNELFEEEFGTEALEDLKEALGDDEPEEDGTVEISDEDEEDEIDGGGADEADEDDEDELYVISESPYGKKPKVINLETLFNVYHLKNHISLIKWKKLDLFGQTPLNGDHLHQSEKRRKSRSFLY